MCFVEFKRRLTRGLSLPLITVGVQLLRAGIANGAAAKSHEMQCTVKKGLQAGQEAVGLDMPMPVPMLVPMSEPFRTTASVPASHV
jgi:hypothetical protein